MAKHSISEAAEIAGISRQYLHRKYIKGGVISVETLANDKKVIDSAELKRVFPDRFVDEKVTASDRWLQSENEQLKRQLSEEKERSSNYWKLIERLSIEHKPTQVDHAQALQEQEKRHTEEMTALKNEIHRQAEIAQLNQQILREEFEKSLKRPDGKI